MGFRDFVGRLIGGSNPSESSRYATPGGKEKGPETFTAVDVETANPDFASICQIGVAVFGEGKLQGTWTSLIDPEDYFDPMNVSIHGITSERVRGKPTFPQVFPDLSSILSDTILVHHTHFDRTSLGRAMARHHLPEIEAQWLDSAKVVRRAWAEFSESGYGLRNVAGALGISFNHHDALEDAIACGHILLRATEHSGLSVADWLGRLEESYSNSIRQEGNPEGPLFGETVVFTGKLSMSRRFAAEIAAEAGCNVANSVTKATTLLVVGLKDVRRTNGREKSAKHRRAETLLNAGHPISIISEEDFTVMSGRG